MQGTKMHRNPSNSKPKFFLEVLYQDHEIAVVNKPHGLLSVPFNGCRTKTAQDILESLLRKTGRYSSKHKPYAVHRLDRETSGVMVFALTEQAQIYLMDNWQEIVSQRTYIAVGENPSPKTRLKPLPCSGTFEEPLAYNAYNVAYVPRKPQEGEKPDPRLKTISARTNYSILLQGRTHTLFRLDLDTGRKNQIRAHLSYHGYPLAGDKNYRARTDPFGRLALHARNIEFLHPVTKEKMFFEVPEPAEWQSFVERTLEKK